MIESLPAITAAQAGRITLAADVGVAMVTAASGGGDRLDTDIRFVRTRGAVETELIRETIYGPRNIEAGNAVSTAYSEASRRASGNLYDEDTAQEGDVYKLEAAIVVQKTSGTAHEVTFPTDRNKLIMSAA